MACLRSGILSHLGLWRIQSGCCVGSDLARGERCLRSADVNASGSVEHDAQAVPGVPGAAELKSDIWHPVSRNCMNVDLV